MALAATWSGRRYKRCPKVAGTDAPSETEQMLRKSRGERQEVNLLRYYVLDALREMPEPHCPMLEACARKVGVLRPNETVAE